MSDDIKVEGDVDSGIFNMGRPAAEVLWYVGKQLKDNAEEIEAYILSVPNKDNTDFINLEVRIADKDTREIPDNVYDLH